MQDGKYTKGSENANSELFFTQREAAHLTGPSSKLFIVSKVISNTFVRLTNDIVLNDLSHIAMVYQILNGHTL